MRIFCIYWLNFYLLATFKTLSSDDITVEDVFPICHNFEVSTFSYIFLCNANNTLKKLCYLFFYRNEAI